MTLQPHSAPSVEPAAPIARAKHELEQMIDLNPQVMLLVERNGTVVRANRALLAFGGHAGFDDILGHPLDAVFRLEEPQALHTLLGTRVYRSEQVRAVRADEEHRDLVLTAISAGPDTDLLVVLAADVTEQARSSSKLEEAHKREAVRALMGGLMHRVNQPLTVIMVTAKLMEIALGKDVPDTAELGERLATIPDLVMEIKRLLQQARNLNGFVTEPYVGGQTIVDLDRSAQP